ncbi:MAG: [FeFe] hydrogenase H-cluster radical SAM maturase HydE, partial [Planctomycetes bacterium]|nr:[FeFe] hydrogenase H-cluster radical SAM maturase HydE [Planctomycetota bacterium]
IKLTASLDAEMFSFGPFIPHPQTPLAETPMPKLTKLLRVIAEARVMTPDARILVTTALETLDQDAARQGLLAGANSLMINVTPLKYRKLYDIYPQRFGTDLKTQEHIDRVIGLLKSLGRAPTDLSV